MASSARWPLPLTGRGQCALVACQGVDTTALQLEQRPPPHCPHHQQADCHAAAMERPYTHIAGHDDMATLGFQLEGSSRNSRYCQVSALCLPASCA